MVLLDPMCGMGTILIEAAKQCTASTNFDHLMYKCFKIATHMHGFSYTDSHTLTRIRLLTYAGSDTLTHIHLLTYTDSNTLTHIN